MFLTLCAAKILKASSSLVLAVNGSLLPIRPPPSTTVIGVADIFVLIENCLIERAGRRWWSEGRVAPLRGREW